MAVLKHNALKNRVYRDALNYVLYKHNEETGEQFLDQNGNPVLRDEYYLDGINCDPYSFAMECEETNRLYGKNTKKSEIKQHHFIISYDPKDADECGLTGEQAQLLSMEWAKKCIPGFQILVCTHMDGHNESGNIHTHIITNSVRKYDTGIDCYGERLGDHKAGNKLHLTLDYLEYMQKELMFICRRENLHQVDLLSPSPEKISDKEFRAKQTGQRKLDKLNEEIQADGLEPAETVFQTQKQYLRNAILAAANEANDFAGFSEILKNKYGVILKESRGRWSYLHPDRDKYITERALGSLFEKESVLTLISEHESISTNRKLETIELHSDEESKLETPEQCRAVFYMHTQLQLVVDLQKCAKAQDSIAYANKVKLSNLKMMAETILFIQQNGFNSLSEVEKAYDIACQQFESSPSPATRNTKSDLEIAMNNISGIISNQGQSLHKDFSCYAVY